MPVVGLLASASKALRLLFALKQSRSFSGILNDLVGLPCGLASPLLELLPSSALGCCSSFFGLLPSSALGCCPWTAAIFFLWLLSSLRGVALLLCFCFLFPSWLGARLSGLTHHRRVCLHRVSPGNVLPSAGGGLSGPTRTAKLCPPRHREVNSTGSWLSKGGLQSIDHRARFLP